MTKQKALETLKKNWEANVEVYVKLTKGEATSYRGDGKLMSKDEALADSAATIRTLMYVIELLEK
jgi:hypothetical protein